MGDKINLKIEIDDKTTGDSTLSIPVTLPTRNLDDERIYLETMLNNRFNFYFVFMGAIAVGVTWFDENFEKSAVCFVAGIVSLIFWMALYRTYGLVSAVLTIWVEECERQTSGCHPYAKIRKKAETEFKSIPSDANLYIAMWIPGVITLALFLLSAHYLWPGFLNGFFGSIPPDA